MSTACKSLGVGSLEDSKAKMSARQCERACRLQRLHTREKPHMVITWGISHTV